MLHGSLGNNAMKLPTEADLKVNEEIGHNFQTRKGLR
jgi:hypothetical protein